MPSITKEEMEMAVDSLCNGTVEPTDAAREMEGINISAFCSIDAQERQEKEAQLLYQLNNFPVKG